MNMRHGKLNMDVCGKMGEGMGHMGYTPSWNSPCGEVSVRRRTLENTGAVVVICNAPVLSRVNRLLQIKVILSP